MQSLEARLDAHDRFGLNSEYHQPLMSFGQLLDLRSPFSLGPLQFEDVDLGGETVRSAKDALWIGQEGELPFVLVVSFVSHPMPRWAVDICVPPGETGVEFVRAIFDLLAQAVEQSSSYRGKVLGLGDGHSQRGQVSTGIRVIRLPKVTRAELILGQRTLELLDRNVFQFVARRPKLAELGMSQKKGLLLYGPPGTGKTHTIRYLASELGHTTLVLTATQVQYLDEAMSLARMLAPSLVVIEDVDLIARSRDLDASVFQESLLNKLLNEMDGLTPDAAVTFVLTTNRPQTLEAALAGRPGRIDQAIEFPLPDENARRRLSQLYRFGLDLPKTVEDELVKRTSGMSAAFIRELMRRIALAYDSDTSADEALSEAIDEMVDGAGSLGGSLFGVGETTVGF